MPHDRRSAAQKADMQRTVERRKARAAKFAEYARLRSEGWTLQEIADKFRSTPTAVWTILQLRAVAEATKQAEEARKAS